MYNLEFQSRFSSLEAITMINRDIKDEALLIKELSRGNIIAFNTLFKIYSNRLYHFAYRYLKSVTLSEELVQDVFMKIWEKRKDLKEELSIKSYLFTIAFNIIRKHFRSEMYHSKFLKMHIPIETDLKTEQTITNNSLHDYVEELVQKLPYRRREVFIKSRLDGKSIKEIAEEMGISHKTVENHLTDALKIIRLKIQNEMKL